jgi:hypothetical protein
MVASQKRRDDEIITEEKDVAVNKSKLYKLINVKKFDKAKSYLYQEQNNVYQMAIDKLKPYIDQNIIYEEEIDTFIQIIEKNLIYNMLKENGNIKMNVIYLNELIERKKKLETMKKIRKC